MDLPGPAAVIGTPGVPLEARVNPRVRAHLEPPRPVSHPGYAKREEELALARALAG